MKTVKAASLDSDKDFFDVAVIEVIEQMPSLMLAIKGASSFPPQPVLNDLFSKGKVDDGMSGGVIWQPFDLSTDEYNILKTEISDKYEIAFRENKELDCMCRYSDWQKKSLKYCRSAR